MIEIAVFTALGLLVGALLFMWLVTQIRYRIGSRQLKIVLFGVPVRRISFDSIEIVTKRRGEGLAEYWWSTMRPKHRLLVIRRKSGIFRNVFITPKNRYVFKTNLERAMGRTTINSPLSSPNQEDAENEDGVDSRSTLVASGPNVSRTV